jgi:undecaprenyl-diphosphatase
LDELLELDTKLLLYLNGLGSPSWDFIWLYLSRTLSWITLPIYGLSLILSYRLFGIKKVVFISILALIMLSSTEYLSIFTKESIARLRPCYNPEIKDLIRTVPKYCGGKFSYFSAHAINSFAFASFFALLLKNRLKYVPVALIIWAFLVSYSRIYLGVHYPLDVLTGILLGIVFGGFANRVHRTVGGYIK